MPYGFVRIFFSFFFFFFYLVGKKNSEIFRPPPPPQKKNYFYFLGVLRPQEHFLAEIFFSVKNSTSPPPHLHAPAQSSEHSPHLIPTISV